MSSKINIEESIEILSGINAGMLYFAKDEEYELYAQAIKNILAHIERLERTIKSMSEEITHKQDEYCKHYCNALREYGQLQDKANKYDSLVYRIEEKYKKLTEYEYDSRIEEIVEALTDAEKEGIDITENKKYYKLQCELDELAMEKDKTEYQAEVLQELLDTES